MQPPEKAPEEQAPQEEESPSMSSGTTEGLDGDIEYEPFIPTNPTIEQPTVEMSPGGPSEPLPPPPPTQPVPAPKGRGTKRAALLGGVAGAVIAALVVGGVAITRDSSSSTSSSAPVTSTAPSESSGGSSGSSGSGSQSAPTSSSAQSPTGPEGVAPAMDIRAVLRKVEPSVVAIETGLVSQNGGIFGRGAGTGVIISDDGLVLTNNHVIEQAGSIKVKLADGRELNADLVGSSPADDVALIKIRDVSGLTAAELGNSSDLEVGDEVVAIGNALDLEGTPTVTRGIVSALNRSIDAGNESLSNLIQTDAAINPGNSGGPLVNAAGQVVGIDTAIVDGSQNIGFAIAIDSIKPLITDLKNGGGDVRGTAFLGVSSVGVDELDQPTLDQYGITVDSGAVIVQATPGSAAEELGLQEGDVVTSVDGTAITSPDDLGTAIRKHEVGDEIKVEWLRDGESQSGTAKLGSRATGN
jgi:putative serine protease PepD